MVTYRILALYRRQVTESKLGYERWSNHQDSPVKSLLGTEIGNLLTIQKKRYKHCIRNTLNPIDRKT